jgi:hypothetical protein
MGASASYDRAAEHDSVISHLNKQSNQSNAAASSANTANNKANNSSLNSRLHEDTVHPKRSLSNSFLLSLHDQLYDSAINQLNFQLSLPYFSAQSNSVGLNFPLHNEPLLHLFTPNNNSSNPSEPELQKSLHHTISSLAHSNYSHTSAAVISQRLRVLRLIYAAYSSQSKKLINDLDRKRLLSQRDRFIHYGNLAPASQTGLQTVIEIQITLLRAVIETKQWNVVQTVLNSAAEALIRTPILSFAPSTHFPPTIASIAQPLFTFLNEFARNEAQFTLEMRAKALAIVFGSALCRGSLEDLLNVIITALLSHKSAPEQANLFADIASFLPNLIEFENNSSLAVHSAYDNPLWPKCHELRYFRHLYTGSWTCDVCKNGMGNDQPVLHCEECQRDHCAKCVELENEREQKAAELHGSFASLAHSHTPLFIKPISTLNICILVLSQLDRLTSSYLPSFIQRDFALLKLSEDRFILWPQYNRNSDQKQAGEKEKSGKTAETEGVAVLHDPLKVEVTAAVIQLLINLLQIGAENYENEENYAYIVCSSLRLLRSHLFQLVLAAVPPSVMHISTENREKLLNIIQKLMQNTHFKAVISNSVQREANFTFQSAFQLFFPRISDQLGYFLNLIRSNNPPAGLKDYFYCYFASFSFHTALKSALLSALQEKPWGAHNSPPLHAQLSSVLSHLVGQVNKETRALLSAPKESELDLYRPLKLPNPSSNLPTENVLQLEQSFDLLLLIQLQRLIFDAAAEIKRRSEERQQNELTAKNIKAVGATVQSVEAKEEKELKEEKEHKKEITHSQEANAPPKGSNNPSSMSPVALIEVSDESIAEYVHLVLKNYLSSLEAFTCDALEFYIASKHEWDSLKFGGDEILRASFIAKLVRPALFSVFALVSPCETVFAASLLNSVSKLLRCVNKVNETIHRARLAAEKDMGIEEIPSNSAELEAQAAELERKEAAEQGLGKFSPGLIIGPGLSVHQINSTPTSSAFLVLSSQPLKPLSERVEQVYYYEVHIEDLGTVSGRHGIGVGMAHINYSLARMPGWDASSFALHGDDGKVFNGKSTGDKYGPLFAVGDVIGCGLNIERKEAFWTHNGKSLGVGITNADVATVYHAAVGSISKGEKFRINFGAKPFVFKGLPLRNSSIKLRLPRFQSPIVITEVVESNDKSKEMETCAYISGAKQLLIIVDRSDSMNSAAEQVDVYQSPGRQQLLHSENKAYWNEAAPRLSFHSYETDRVYLRFSANCNYRVILQTVLPTDSLAWLTQHFSQLLTNLFGHLLATSIYGSKSSSDEIRQQNWLNNQLFKNGISKKYAQYPCISHILQVELDVYNSENEGGDQAILDWLIPKHEPTAQSSPVFDGFMLEIIENRDSAKELLNQLNKINAKSKLRLMKSVEGAAEEVSRLIFACYLYHTNMLSHAQTCAQYLADNKNSADIELAGLVALMRSAQSVRSLFAVMKGQGVDINQFVLLAKHRAHFICSVNPATSQPTVITQHNTPHLQTLSISLPSNKPLLKTNKSIEEVLASPSPSPVFSPSPEPILTYHTTEESQSSPENQLPLQLSQFSNDSVALEPMSSSKVTFSAARGSSIDSTVKALKRLKDVMTFRQEDLAASSAANTAAITLADQYDSTSLLIKSINEFMQLPMEERSISSRVESALRHQRERAVCRLLALKQAKLQIVRMLEQKDCNYDLSILLQYLSSSYSSWRKGVEDRPLHYLNDLSSVGEAVAKHLTQSYFDVISVLLENQSKLSVQNQLYLLDCCNIDYETRDFDNLYGLNLIASLTCRLLLPAANSSVEEDVEAKRFLLKSAEFNHTVLLNKASNLSINAEEQLQLKLSSWALFRLLAYFAAYSHANSSNNLNTLATANIPALDLSSPTTDTQLRNALDNVDNGNSVQILKSKYSSNMFDTLYNVIRLYTIQRHWQFDYETKLTIRLMIESEQQEKSKQQKKDVLKELLKEKESKIIKQQQVSSWLCSACNLSFPLTQPQCNSCKAVSSSFLGCEDSLNRIFDFRFSALPQGINILSNLPSQEKMLETALKLYQQHINSMQDYEVAVSNLFNSYSPYSLLHLKDSSLACNIPAHSHLICNINNNRLLSMQQQSITDYTIIVDFRFLELPNSSNCPFVLFSPCTTKQLESAGAKSEQLPGIYVNEAGCITFYPNNSSISTEISADRDKYAVKPNYWHRFVLIVRSKERSGDVAQCELFLNGSLVCTSNTPDAFAFNNNQVFSMFYSLKSGSSNFTQTQIRFCQVKLFALNSSEVSLIPTSVLFFNLPALGVEDSVNAVYDLTASKKLNHNMQVAGGKKLDWRKQEVKLKDNSIGNAQGKMERKVSDDFSVEVSNNELNPTAESISTISASVMLRSSSGPATTDVNNQFNKDLEVISLPNSSTSSLENAVITENSKASLLSSNFPSACYYLRVNAGTYFKLSHELNSHNSYPGIQLWPSDTEEHYYTYNPLHYLTNYTIVIDVRLPRLPANSGQVFSLLTLQTEKPQVVKHTGFDDLDPPSLAKQNSLSNNNLSINTNSTEHPDPYAHNVVINHEGLVSISSAALVSDPNVKLVQTATKFQAEKWHRVIVVVDNTVTHAMYIFIDSKPHSIILSSKLFHDFGPYRLQSRFNIFDSNISHELDAHLRFVQLRQFSMNDKDIAKISLSSPSALKSIEQIATQPKSLYFRYNAGTKIKVHYNDLLKPLANPAHFSIAMWLKSSQLPANKMEQVIMCKISKNTTDRIFWKFFLTQQEGITQLGFTIASSGNTAPLLVPLSNQGCWLHIACTFDGSNISLYTNGLLRKSSSVTAKLDYEAEKTPLLIGSSNIAMNAYCSPSESLADSLEGVQLAEILVWSSVLNNSQIVETRYGGGSLIEKKSQLINLQFKDSLQYQAVKELINSAWSESVTVQCTLNRGAFLFDVPNEVRSCMSIDGIPAGKSKLPNANNVLSSPSVEEESNGSFSDESSPRSAKTAEQISFHPLSSCAYCSTMNESAAKLCTSCDNPLERSEKKEEKSHRQFDYVNDFDDRGICYWLGLNKRKNNEWKNPADLGLVTVRASKYLEGRDVAPINSIVGRTAERCLTNPSRLAAVHWFCIDFNDLLIKPSHYTLRHYSSADGGAVRNWYFQGFHPTKQEWTTLKSHKNDYSLQSAGQSHTWKLDGSITDYYSKFRIFMRAKHISNVPNYTASASLDYLPLSGFELYGEIQDTLANPIQLTLKQRKLYNEWAIREHYTALANNATGWLNCCYNQVIQNKLTTGSLFAAKREFYPCSAEFNLYLSQWLTLLLRLARSPSARQYLAKAEWISLLFALINVNRINLDGASKESSLFFKAPSNRQIRLLSLRLLRFLLPLIPPQRVFLPNYYPPFLTPQILHNIYSKISSHNNNGFILLDYCFKLIGQQLKTLALNQNSEYEDRKSNSDHAVATVLYNTVTTDTDDSTTEYNYEEKQACEPRANSTTINNIFPDMNFEQFIQHFNLVSTEKHDWRWEIVGLFRDLINSSNATAIDKEWNDICSQLITQGLESINSSIKHKDISSILASLCVLGGAIEPLREGARIGVILPSAGNNSVPEKVSGTLVGLTSIDSIPYTINDPVVYPISQLIPLQTVNNDKDATKPAKIDNEFNKLNTGKPFIQAEIITDAGKRLSALSENPLTTTLVNSTYLSLDNITTESAAFISYSNLPSASQILNSIIHFLVSSANQSSPTILDCIDATLRRYCFRVLNGLLSNPSENELLASRLDFLKELSSVAQLQCASLNELDSTVDNLESRVKELQYYVFAPLQQTKAKNPIEITACDLDVSVSTIAELRERLDKMNLSTQGNRMELKERLIKHDPSFATNVAVLSSSSMAYSCASQIVTVAVNKSLLPVELTLDPYDISPINTHDPILSLHSLNTIHIILMQSGRVFISNSDISATQWSLNVKFQSLLFGPPNNPVAVQPKIISVAVGAVHALLLTDMGLVYSLGSNDSGQCGFENFTLSSYATPALIDTLIGQRIDLIACGASTSFCVNNRDKQLYVFGTNSASQLGLNHSNKVLLPTLCSCLPSTLQFPIIQIGSGTVQSILLDSKGCLYIAGASSSVGLMGNKLTFILVPLTIPPIVQISVAAWHVLYLTAEGSVYSSGKCEYGALGLSNKAGSTDAQPITKISLLPENEVFVDINTSNVQSCAVTDRGEVYYWGLPLDKQLLTSLALSSQTPATLNVLEPTRLVISNNYPPIISSVSSAHRFFLVVSPSNHSFRALQKALLPLTEISKLMWQALNEDQQLISKSNSEDNLAIYKAICTPHPHAAFIIPHTATQYFKANSTTLLLDQTQYSHLVSPIPSSNNTSLAKFTVAPISSAAAGVLIQNLNELQAAIQSYQANITAVTLSIRLKPQTITAKEQQDSSATVPAPIQLFSIDSKQRRFNLTAATDLTQFELHLMEGKEEYQNTFNIDSKYCINDFYTVTVVIANHCQQFQFQLYVNGLCLFDSLTATLSPQLRALSKEDGFPLQVDSQNFNLSFIRGFHGYIAEAAVWLFPLHSAHIYSLHAKGLNYLFEDQKQFNMIEAEYEQHNFTVNDYKAFHDSLEWNNQRINGTRNDSNNLILVSANLRLYSPAKEFIKSANNLSLYPMQLTRKDSAVSSPFEFEPQSANADKEQEKPAAVANSSIESLSVDHLVCCLWSSKKSSANITKLTKSNQTVKQLLIEKPEYCYYLSNNNSILFHRTMGKTTPLDSYTLVVDCLFPEFPQQPLPLFQARPDFPPIVTLTPAGKLSIFDSCVSTHHLKKNRWLRLKLSVSPLLIAVVMDDRTMVSYRYDSNIKQAKAIIEWKSEEDACLFGLQYKDKGNIVFNSIPIYLRSIYAYSSALALSQLLSLKSGYDVIPLYPALQTTQRSLQSQGPGKLLSEDMLHYPISWTEKAMQKNNGDIMKASHWLLTHCKELNAEEDETRLKAAAASLIGMGLSEEECKAAILYSSADKSWQQVDYEAAVKLLLANHKPTQQIAPSDPTYDWKSRLAKIPEEKLATTNAAYYLASDSSSTSQTAISTENNNIPVAKRKPLAFLPLPPFTQQNSSSTGGNHLQFNPSSPLSSSLNISGVQVSNWAIRRNEFLATTAKTESNLTLLYARQCIISLLQFLLPRRAFHSLFQYENNSSSANIDRSFIRFLRLVSKEHSINQPQAHMPIIRKSILQILAEETQSLGNDLANRQFLSSDIAAQVNAKKLFQRSRDLSLQEFRSSAPLASVLLEESIIQLILLIQSPDHSAVTPKATESDIASARSSNVNLLLWLLQIFLDLKSTALNDNSVKDLLLSQRLFCPQLINLLFEAVAMTSGENRLQLLRCLSSLMNSSAKELEGFELIYNHEKSWLLTALMTQLHCESETKSAPFSQFLQSLIELNLQLVHSQVKHQQAQLQSQSPNHVISAAATTEPAEDSDDEGKEEQFELSGLDFDYVSDFDMNGIVYYLGTDGGQSGSWVNPAISGSMRVTSSGRHTTYAEYNHLSRTPTVALTHGKENAWICFDFLDRLIIPTHYTIRHYTQSSYALRNWVLEATSNPSAMNGNSDSADAWTVLYRHLNDFSLSHKDAAKTWQIDPPVNLPFSKFRIRMTAQNSSNSWHLVCAGFELYGKLLDDNSNSYAKHNFENLSFSSLTSTLASNQFSAAPRIPVWFDRVMLGEKLLNHLLTHGSMREEEIPIEFARAVWNDFTKHYLDRNGKLINLALKKTVKVHQSSTNTISQPLWRINQHQILQRSQRRAAVAASLPPLQPLECGAGFAIDGYSMDNDFSCSLTKEEIEPYWEIDLGENCIVDSVVITKGAKMKPKQQQQKPVEINKEVKVREEKEEEKAAEDPELDEEEDLPSNSNELLLSRTVSTREERAEKLKHFQLYLFASSKPFSNKSFETIKKECEEESKDFVQSFPVLSSGDVLLAMMVTIQPLRYIRIQLANEGALQLAQVEVFGNAEAECNEDSESKGKAKQLNANRSHHFSLESFYRLNSVFNAQSTYELVQHLNRAYDKSNMNITDMNATQLLELIPSSTDLQIAPALLSLNLCPSHYLFRLVFLQHFNRIVSGLLPLVDLSLPRQSSSLTDSTRDSRHFILYSTKKELFQSALTATVTSSIVRPTVDIDLLIAREVVWSRKTDHRARRTLFGQIFTQMISKNDLASYFRLNKGSRVFHVNSIGMRATDAGGPYRDALERMGEELQSPALPLFIKVPNGVLDMGDNRDRFVPRPSAVNSLHLSMYEFIGQLMGAAIRTRSLWNLNLPAVVWKQLVQDKITDQDIRAIDALSFKQLERIQKLEAKQIPVELFNELMQEVKFEVIGSDSKTRELLANGSNIALTWENRHLFLKKLREYRFNEFSVQCAAILRGLATVVPKSLLSLLSWTELESLVCGKGMQRADVDLLEKLTRFSSCARSDPHITLFFEMLRDKFNDEQRSEFLTFVWGRSRLPHTANDMDTSFTIMRAPAKANQAEIDQQLPISHTCGFALELPAYSNVNIMTERILYAVRNTGAIDADGGTARTGTLVLDTDDAQDDSLYES